MDVSVVGIRAVERDGPVKVGDNLVKVLDDVIVETTGDVSVEFRLHAPSSTNYFDDDVNRCVELEQLLRLAEHEEEPVTRRSTQQDIGVDKDSLKHEPQSIG